MAQASKSMTGSHGVGRGQKAAHRFSAAGIHGSLAALLVYSQMAWAAEHGHDYIALRLILAGLLGSGAAWLLSRLLVWLARRRAVDEEGVLRRTSFCLSPLVLILLTPLHHAFFYTALAGPLLAIISLRIRRGYKKLGPAYLKQLAFKTAACLFGLALALAGGELAMYLLYHDTVATGYRSPSMKRSSGLRNPHHRPGFSSRGPASAGPKPPGVKRVLVQGDSVAAGAQRHWQDAIPNRLLSLLNAAQPGRWQMDVLAWAGHEMVHHWRNLQRLGHVTDPDAIVYIWYVNDLEMRKRKRPSSKSALWRGLPFHTALRKTSYLYRFLDIRLGDALPRFGPTYLEYLAEHYQSGTYGWLTFELLLQMWLDKASRLAPRVVVFLYPSLPRAGWQGAPYPLAHLHRQIKLAARGHRVTYPAAVAGRAMGSERADPSSTYGRVRYCKAGQSAGLLVDGPLPGMLAVKPGNYTAEFRLRLGPSDKRGPAARLVVVDLEGGILAQSDLQAPEAPAGPKWRNVSLPFTVGPGGAKDLRLQVVFLGGAWVAVDRISLVWPPRPPAVVVDGAMGLKDQRTWADEFDAHPNRAANQAVAEMIHQAMSGR